MSSPEFPAAATYKVPHRPERQIGQMDRVARSATRTAVVGTSPMRPRQMLATAKLLAGSTVTHFVPMIQTTAHRTAESVMLRRGATFTLQPTAHGTTPTPHVVVAVRAARPATNVPCPIVVDERARPCSLPCRRVDATSDVRVGVGPVDPESRTATVVRPRRCCRRTACVLSSRVASGRRSPEALLSRRGSATSGTARPSASPESGRRSFPSCTDGRRPVGCDFGGLSRRQLGR
jgi:hypothetical protein